MTVNTGLNANTYVYALAIDPATTSTLYAGTYNWWSACCGVFQEHEQRRELECSQHRPDL